MSASIKKGKGSFRGVPFYIEDQQGQDGGRRIVTHEYPLRDDGLTEDLGLRLRNYHVSCLVIGDDYTSQADKLIDALEAKEPGTLKHPFFGTKDVRVSEYKANYSTAHLRVVRFEITFVPAVGEISPLASQDTLFSALSEYSNALNALSDEFASMVEQALDFMNDIMDSPYLALFDETLSFIENVFDGIGSVLNAGSDFKAKLQSFKNRLESLLLQPKVLAAELQSLTQLSVRGSFTGSNSTSGSSSSTTASATTTQSYGGLTITSANDTTASTSSTTAQSAVNFQRVFTQIENLKTTVNAQMSALSTQVSEITDNKLEQVTAAKQNNQTTAVIINRLFADVVENENSLQTISQLFISKTQYSVMRLVVATLVVEYAKTVVEAVTVSCAQSVTERNAEGVQAALIESKQDVRDYMDSIDAQLETLVLAYADNESWASYEALESYRLAVLTDLRTRGETLANSQEVTLRSTQPALVVEFENTGNAKTWERLALRNNVRHPLFCLGGKTLEIIQ